MRRPTLGAWGGCGGGKRWRGTPDSSGGGTDLSDGLRSAACRQGSKALVPGEKGLRPTLPGYDQTGIPRGETRGPR